MSYTDDNKKLLNNIFKMTNLNEIDEDGNTYLHHLVGSGNKEYVKDFLKLCDKKNLESNLINKPNNNNETPFFLAVKNNNQEIAQMLYQNGGNPEIINKDGMNISYDEINQNGGSLKTIIYGERKI